MVEECEETKMSQDSVFRFSLSQSFTLGFLGLYSMFVYCTASLKPGSCSGRLFHETLLMQHFDTGS